MVLLADVIPGQQEVLPVLQPSLDFTDTQEDIIADLNATTWNLRTSGQQYQQVRLVIEEEEEIGEWLRGLPIAQEGVVVDRAIQRP